MTDQTKTHIMVDLETMSLRANAAILSLGAVLFYKQGQPVDLRNSDAYFSMNVHPKWYHHDIRGDRFHVDVETALWWGNQSKEARDAIAVKPVTLPEVLTAFSSWAAQVSGGNLSSTCLWGNGADFDLAVITSAFHQLGSEPPWKFWNHRCYRTLKATHRDVQRGEANGYVPHIALNDAIAQAIHTMQIVSAKQLDLNG